MLSFYARNDGGNDDEEETKRDWIPERSLLWP
jgi:hypothetical protein